MYRSDTGRGNSREGGGSATLVHPSYTTSAKPRRESRRGGVGTGLGERRRGRLRVRLVRGEGRGVST